MESLLEFGISMIENLPAVFLVGRRQRREKSAEGKARKKDSNAVYILLGLLIGLLLLCLILPMLASADQVFGDLLNQVFQALFIEIAIPERLIKIAMMFCWGILFFFGLLRAVKRKKIK